MSSRHFRVLAIPAVMLVIFAILFTSGTILSRAAASPSTVSSAKLPKQMRSGGSSPNQATPPWYDVNWLYRLPVTISNSSLALSNYQVLVTLNSSFAFSHAQPDGSDLRVTLGDGVTEASFWIESWNSISQIAYVWVNVPAIPAGTSTIYLYYGNGSAATASDGAQTFDFFDDHWCQYPGSAGCGSPATNPVLSAGQSWWENTVSFPMVFEDTSLPGRPAYHMLYDGHGVIGHAKGYAYSSDLNTWTEYDGGLPHPPNPNPIMGTGYAGNAQYAWGDAIKVGSTYYMFPSRGPGVTQRVESTDLITWTNFTTLTINDPGGVGTGAAILKEGDGITPILVNNLYWMVYFHGFSPGTMYLASSSNLVDWTYTGSAFLAPTPGGFDAAGLWTPSFVRFGDMYYIYYQGQSNTGTWEIGYARASAYSGGNPIPPDPGSTTWSKSDTNGNGLPDSVLKRGAGGWDSSLVIDPMVRQFSDGRYYLFYTGNSADGYAYSTAPDGPWTKLGSSTAQWTTEGGSPIVANDILTLTEGTGIRSNTIFQYNAVGFRANFGAGSGLMWGGFIDGSQNDRTMVGSVANQPSQLYLKNYVTAEASALLCNNCRASFHTFEVQWRSGNSRAVMDHGAASVSLTSQVPTINIPVTFWSYTGSGAPMYVDWVYVRQYRNPEPSASPGVEQSVVDLRISKTSSPNPVHAGQLLTYSLLVTNTTSRLASGVVVTDTLPVSVLPASVISSQGSCLLSGTVVCNLGDLVGNTGVGITVVVTTTVEGVITNQAIVDSADHELNPLDNQASTNTSVLPTADLSASQVDIPDPARAGDPVTYTISVHNGGPSASASMVLTDTLPVDVSLISATSGGGSCTQASPVVCTLTGLAANGNTQVQVAVQTSIDGIITNTVTVASSTFDNNLANNTNREATVVATQADLAVSQVAQGDPVVYAGFPLTYTITVINDGPNIAANVRLTDTLPGGVTLQSVSPSQGSCISGSPVTCNLSNLGNGQLATVHVVVVPSIDGTLVNTVDVSSSVSDVHPEDNHDQISTTVNPVADLSVSQVDQPDPVRAGYPLTYTITVHNNGPSGSADVTLTDNLDSGHTAFFSAKPSDYCSQKNPVVCTLPGLASGSSTQVQVVVLTTLDGLSLNSVTILAPTYDSDYSNNSSVASTNVLPTADLSVTQQDAPDPVRAEEPLTYTVTVHNAGPSSAASVSLVDTLPANVTPVDAIPDQGSCTLGSQVNCALGSLPSGGDLQVLVVVRPQVSGSISNHVEVSTGTFESYYLNNHADESTTVLPLSSDLSLTLTGDPNPVVAAGAYLTYTAVVVNHGPSRAISPVLTFTLADEIVYVPPTPACTQQGTTVTCALANIPGGDSAQFDLVVQVDPSTFVSSISGSAEIASSVADPVPNNNQDSVSTDLTWQADLGIDIVDHFDPVGSTGVILTYTLVYTNYGPSDALDLSLVDTLPANVAYVAEYSDPACTLAYTGLTVTCDLGNQPAQQRSEVIIAVKVDETAVAPLVDQVDITSARTPDPGPHANQAEEFTEIDPVPPAVSWIAPAVDEGSFSVFARPGLAITLVVTATDNLAVDYVQFRLWDPIHLKWIYLGNVNDSGPEGYTFVWILKSPQDLFPGRGNNQVFAYAYDVAGNEVRARIFIEPTFLLSLPVTMR